MPKILVDDRGNAEFSICDYHRIYLPYLTGDSFTTKSDIYVFNGLPTHGREGIIKLREAGFKIVMDLDDSLDLPIDHVLWPVFNSGIRAELIWCLQNSDVVLTTTSRLAEELSQYNKNVFVVPNGLPFDEKGFTLSEDKKSKSYFVWAGSETHKNDLRELPDLGDRLTVCGYKTDASEPVAKREWMDISQNILPYAKYEHHRSLESYMQSYDGHAVSLAPLEDSNFNRSKSNLKILEAGAKGLPIICSKVDCYDDETLSDYLLYAKDIMQWEDMTSMLYTAPDFAEELGKGLAEHVRKHYTIKQMNDIRREIFKGI